MLGRLISLFTTEQQKHYLRLRYNAARRAWIDHFRNYDSNALTAALRDLGIRENDTLLVHANFSADNGFRGSPNNLVTAFLDLVGVKGTLLMVSQPFRGYAYDYLKQKPKFDVRRTMSMMGLVTEVFRRRPDTRRSLHPTHPVLAHGARAEYITEAHEKVLFPCGPGTPFEKLYELEGKILFFDVSSSANTFFHHVEDSIKERLDFPLYAQELFSVETVDWYGNCREVKTYAFAKGVRRDTQRLEQRMLHENKMRRATIGNTTLFLAGARDFMSSISEMMDAGERLIQTPLRSTDVDYE